MAITRDKKQQILQNLLKAWEKSKSVAFSAYQGLPVKEMSILRRDIRKKGGELKVAKKTLIKLAAKKLNQPEISEEVLAGPVAVVFGYEDEVAAVKTLQQFAKTHPQIQLLGGILERKILTGAEAKYLATIPEKKELIAQMVSLLKSPLRGFYGVLSGVLRGFVRATAEYQKKAAASAPAPAVEPAAPPQPQL